MASVQINRGTSEEINATPITDGLICFDTDNNYIYLDNDGTRESYGGVNIEANPEGSPSEILRNLELDGTIYKISGGHEIKNTSGTTLTQRDIMRFNGVYAHDTSGTTTTIDVVRSLTPSQLENLTGNAINGFQWVEDENDDLPLTSSMVEYRNGQTVTDALDNSLQASVVAKVETSPTTSAYSVGQYLMYEGSFYKVTASISIGDNLVVGTNITLTNVGDEIGTGGGGGASWTDVTGTLTAGSTSITLYDSAITTSSTLDFYTDVFGVNPITVSVLSGSVTLTFPAMANNLGVKVRVS